MRLEEIRRIMMLTVLIGSMVCFRSVEAIAWGAILSSWLDAAIVTSTVKKQFRCGFSEQFRELWKPLAACLAMGTAVWGTGFLVKTITQAVLPMLTVQIMAGIAVYTMFMILLNKPILNFVRNLYK